jgi:hypothetical protein
VHGDLLRSCERRQIVAAGFDYKRSLVALQVRGRARVRSCSAHTPSRLSGHHQQVLRVDRHGPVGGPVELVGGTTSAGGSIQAGRRYLTSGSGSSGGWDADTTRC